MLFKATRSPIFETLQCYSDVLQMFCNRTIMQQISEAFSVKLSTKMSVYEETM